MSSLPKFPHEFISFPAKSGRERGQPEPLKPHHLQELTAVLYVLMKFELVSALRGVIEHKNTEIRSFISHFIKQRRVAEEFEQCLFQDISSFEKLSRLMQIARYVYWVKSPALAHSLCSGPIAIRLLVQYEKGVC